MFSFNQICRFFSLQKSACVILCLTNSQQCKSTDLTRYIEEQTNQFSTKFVWLVSFTLFALCVSWIEPNFKKTIQSQGSWTRLNLSVCLTAAPWGAVLWNMNENQYCKNLKLPTSTKHQNSEEIFLNRYISRACVQMYVIEQQPLSITYSTFSAELIISQ